VSAQDLAERGVQEVRGGVVALGVAARALGDQRLYGRGSNEPSNAPKTAVFPSIFRTSPTGSRHPCPTTSPVSLTWPPLSA